jgi:TRAP-type mannitol/chloroaromatic compound transport system permease small subunit
MMISWRVSFIRLLFMSIQPMLYSSYLWNKGNSEGAIRWLLITTIANVAALLIFKIVGALIKKLIPRRNANEAEESRRVLPL